MSARHPGDDVLERAVAALREVPPPPEIARVRAALAGAAGTVGARVLPRRGRAALAWAASALVLLAAGVAWRVATSRRTADQGPGTGQPAAPARLAADVGADLSAWRGDAPRDPGSAGAGDRVRANRPSRLRLDGRVRVDLEPEATLVLGGPLEVELRHGRAAFEVAHDAKAPFRVRTEHVTVRDVGTRFALDREDVGGRERVLVTVEDGRVEANGVPLSAGLGLAFLQGVAAGPPWPLDARPTVALEAEDPSPAAGAPVVLRVFLENPTDGWIPLPEHDGLRAPLVVEVTDPAGATSPVRVTASMLEPDGPPAGAIPPRGRAVFRVRFDRTFGSPGTYRLRAIFRPAGAVERPSSPEVRLTVR